MPLPQLPDRDRPDAWKSGRYLEPGERETRWAITGFADYAVTEEAGRLRVWHLRHADASGHRRKGLELQLQTKNGTSRGYGLRRKGCPVWVSVERLRGLLECETG